MAPILEDVELNGIRGRIFSVGWMHVVQKRLFRYSQENRLLKCIFCASSEGSGKGSCW